VAIPTSAKDALFIGLKKSKRSHVTEVIESPPKLSMLPCLTSWKEDGGAFLTLPLVYTEHPETKVPNLGIYRMHRYNDFSTGMHMQIGKGGGFHLARAQELGQSLSVNVFLGGPPAAILAAIAPLPEMYQN
jgi:4-hydroxybenzoate decarboxylase subunit C